MQPFATYDSYDITNDSPDSQSFQTRKKHDAILFVFNFPHLGIGNPRSGRLRSRRQGEVRSLFLKKSNIHNLFSFYRMKKCFQQGSPMANMKKADDEQKCAIVNQLSQCFKEMPDCETEIKGFVRSLSSVSYFRI